ncbi:hypothetical protein I79_000754 [Cricetulus griseus]|uniref:Uncharacterized protein n=1 Tax=Cricetulus griseus TaxID=10029 RepID=G3GSY2_CRIGR|nr:hypothetical protein I79_000754 [Cricetulus griseus]
MEVCRAWGPASLSLCSSLLLFVTSLRPPLPTVKHTFTRAIQTAPVLTSAKNLEEELKGSFFSQTLS